MKNTLKYVSILFISIIISSFMHTSAYAGKSDYAILSDTECYIYGYRIPYLLEDKESYYIKMDYLVDAGFVNFFASYEEDEEEYYRLYLDYVRQEDWYNLDWRSIYETGDRIGKITSSNRSLYYYEDEIKLYKIKQCDYVALDSLEVGDHRLGYEKSTDTYYMGELPKGKLKKDSIYEFLKKAVGNAKTEKQMLENVHDQQVLYMTYSYDSPPLDIEKSMTRSQLSALTTLKSKKGVCEDYAYLYKELCDRMMIPCKYVTGYGNGGAHGWNYVYVDKKWLYIDVTWDDPLNNKYKKASDVRKTYFLKTDKQMINDHYWSDVDNLLPEFDKSWKKIDRKNIKSTDEFRKAAAYAAYSAKGENKKYTFHITAKNPWSVSTGSAFLYHYPYWWSFSISRSSNGKTVTIVFNP
ncbi:MAG: hypothetical protein GX306_13805 [Clostridiales bacterium]|jgi:transglutaminase-like putative cysteine protease|nr:hypothetical protein [Clostridiales bacterium]